MQFLCIIPYPFICTKRAPQSYVSIRSMSSCSSSKSHTSKFDSMRFLVTDFGITITPLWIWYFIITWAALLSYLSAISVIFGSSRSEGSSGFFQGLSGLPSGLYAVSTMPCSSQYSLNWFWFKYGWHSTYASI